MRIIDTIGQSPTFWDRDVIFVANLMGLFFGNEEETRMLADEVGEVDSYGGRLLPMLDLVYRGPGRNHLVLERAPDPALIHYFEECDLSLPDYSVLTHADYLDLGESHGEAGEIVGRVRDLAPARLDGYVTDDILSSLAGWCGKTTFSTADGSRRGNNKALLHDYLLSSDLPVPLTERAESTEEVVPCLERIRDAGYTSAVIRAAMGASGIGMIKVEELPGEDIEVPVHFFREGPCLIQAWLKPGEFGVRSVCSPSIQLFLDDESVRLYDVTEQILSDESIHQGNESPPSYLREVPGLDEELARQAGEVGAWLHGEGYRGTASVDFLVTFESERNCTVYVCEINARVTGATYPSVLARHFFPGGAWLLRNLRFTEPMSGEDLLSRLRLSGDLYIPGESEFGVFPVNFNYGKDGLVHKGQFLCLSRSRLGNRQLLHLAELDLPCVPERD